MGFALKGHYHEARQFYKPGHRSYGCPSFTVPDPFLLRGAHHLERVLKTLMTKTSRLPKNYHGCELEEFPDVNQNYKSMKELLVIFPSMLIGTVLLCRQEMMYVTIFFMLAIFVLSYNEKSAPFYYQFVAFMGETY